MLVSLEHFRCNKSPSWPLLLAIIMKRVLFCWQEEIPHPFHSILHKTGIQRFATVLRYLRIRVSTLLHRNSKFPVYRLQFVLHNNFQKARSVLFCKQLCSIVYVLPNQSCLRLFIPLLYEWRKWDSMGFSLPPVRTQNKIVSQTL